MLRLRFGSIVISIVNRQVSNNGSQMLNATSTPELSLLFKRWQSIGDRSRSGSASVPAHNDTVELQTVLLNKRNDQDQSSGSE